MPAELSRIAPPLRRLASRNGGRAVCPPNPANRRTPQPRPICRNGGRAVMPAEPHDLTPTSPRRTSRNGGRAVMPAELGTLTEGSTYRLRPQWRAGCYARRTSTTPTNDRRMLTAAMEGGLLCPPNSQLATYPAIRPMLPQWRAGCYARRTQQDPLRWALRTCRRNGGRAVMPAEPNKIRFAGRSALVAAMEGGLLCPPNLAAVTAPPCTRKPQWRAGCYARRTGRDRPTGVGISSGPQWRAGCYARRTPLTTHTSPLGRSAAMEGGLLCPPNPTRSASLGAPHLSPQWRAGCYARRT